MDERTFRSTRSHLVSTICSFQVLFGLSLAAFLAALLSSAVCTGEGGEGAGRVAEKASFRRAKNSMSAIFTPCRASSNCKGDDRTMNGRTEVSVSIAWLPE